MPDDSSPETGFRSIGEIARKMVADAQKDCDPPIGYGREIDGRRGVTSTRDGLTDQRLMETSDMTALADNTPICRGAIGERSENTSDRRAE